MQPPPDETPAQHTARQKRELDAQRHSDEIDEDIKQERAEAKKQRGVIKVLLLGQSESGKSTTLKNFRMQYAKGEWSAERCGWRAVVQLNVVRCITTILRVLTEEMNGDSPVDSEDDRTSAGQDSSDEESLKDDMKALWDDKTVRLALKRRKLQLPDSVNFFLKDLDRIATRNYVVTDQDIVRARLRTVGIQEHRLFFERGPWGQARFSPISVFDQRLEEDSRVNRLEDSINLWTSICSSKLLAKTQLILFLNKCDLLRKKLKRGVRVNQYLPSYGDRPNEVNPVIRYFRDKFKEIQKQCSPEPRTTYIYPTTVTDTEGTITTLESVRDGVLRENLTTSQLI
ncbi:G-protein alpha subunit CPG-3 [Laccaria bicolor S238N-H82]|uniref:G-protein alpha subunit CPG-3 n=1 Tax=Laccaria bicolor (strain S238N-H82 / ATCC MYA-4686) TaxID=486041 RepID=B0D4K3_LACBS|nr:G-protein alpha subunit CPG-3 [Laccaria bicolor S238N-H82]EDR10358.1 G-protein alpha subunit CPG-3 [Laccaria bicolor S238N-H82]|eukprot:XP_001878808.1 G-protein alpha subunit CPG-3 [Laccaria bicolor S238N-H82]